LFGVIELVERHTRQKRITFERSDAFQQPASGNAGPSDFNPPFPEVVDKSDLRRNLPQLTSTAGTNSTYRPIKHL
jgi:hypothetical protein